MIIGITMQQQPSSVAHEELHSKQLAAEGHQASNSNIEAGDDGAPLHLPEETGYMPSHDTHNPYAHQMPEQVYVNTMGHHAPSNMMGEIEQQFQQFGLQHVENSSSHHLYQPNPQSTENQSGIAGDSSENNTDPSENEEDPVKLFVGQIPKNMNEVDIFPTFDCFGPLKDVAIIRDKQTGMHRGCAFVTFWSLVDAENARETLHDKFTFPGGKRCAQVKRAEPSAIPENKLFVGMLSRTAEEQDVRDLFEPFGEIREIYMIRNPDGSSKCAAFLRFVNRDCAVQAIDELNGVEVMEGAQRPLIVKFADTKQQRQLRHMRNIRRQEIMGMIGPGGYPAFPHPQGPPMGIPGMGLPPPGGPQYPIPPHGYHVNPQFPSGQGPPPHPVYMYHPQAYTHISPYHPYHHQQQPQAARIETSRPNPRPREGPPGANLFVYHLPHDLTDADLATAFNPFGNVISAKVYVDKFTAESKGFGFVSYDSMVSAEQAIEQMNGFQIGNKRLKVQHKRVHQSCGSYGPTQQTISPPDSVNSGTTGYY